MAGSGQFAIEGRDRELAEIEGDAARARKGRGSFILIGGDAGIGKTRLAEEVAALAERAGQSPLWGRAWEGGGAPAFWPWTEIFRCSELAAEADVLRRRWPWFAPSPGEVRSSFTGSDIERFAFFDAVAGALATAAARRPLVLLLDDLHAADLPSLQLTLYVAKRTTEAAILLVGLYRAHEPTTPGPVRSAIAKLAAVDRHLQLDGLEDPDLAKVMESGYGLSPSARLLSMLARRTEGNPLFLHELLRVLIRKGRPVGGSRISFRGIDLPASVTETVRARFDPLSEEARKVLRIAAVVGREFELGILRRASGAARDDVLVAMDEAVAADLVEAADPVEERYRFLHALMAETLREELPGPERTAIHATVARALEGLEGDEQARHFSALAHHHYLAGSAGDQSAALEACERAGTHALRRLAFEEATVHFERALELLPAADHDPERRCRLLLRLGQALYGSGDLKRSRSVFVDAFPLALRTGRDEIIGAAAIGATGFWASLWDIGPETIRILEDALAAMSPQDGTFRAAVLAGLGREIVLTGDLHRSNDLCEAAIAMARRLDDPTTLAYALAARHTALRPPPAPEKRLEEAREILELASQRPFGPLVFIGRVFELAHLLTVGDVVTFERRLEQLEELCRQAPLPAFRWFPPHFRAARALLLGRFDEAEAEAAQAFSAGTQAGAVDAAQAFAIQSFQLHRERGTLHVLEDDAREAVRRYPEIPAWQAHLAFVLSSTGQLEESRVYADALAADGFSTVRQDAALPATATLLTETCVTLADETLAGEIYDLLAPFEGQNVIGGVGSVFFGTVDHFLGILAATAENTDRAMRHLESAFAIHTKLGARPFLARTSYHLGRLLAGRDDPASRERARSLLASARQSAMELEMAGLVREIEAVDFPEHTEDPPVAGTELWTRRGTFRNAGDVWCVGLDGEEIRVKSLAGFAHVARLLADPGREIHVLELATGSHSDGLFARESTRGAHDTAPDPIAQSQYRTRLEGLREELGEAEERNDLGRAEAARAEIEVLASELAGSGLGGRTRRTGSAAERARVNVTRQIRRALDRIAAHHEALGRVLDRSIKTGNFCRYDPDPRAPVRWIL